MSDTENPYEPTQDDKDNPCVICKEIFDGITSMIECESCFKWFHNNCLDTVVSEPLHFICKWCRKKASETGTIPKPTGCPKRKSVAATIDGNKNKKPVDNAEEKLACMEDELAKLKKIIDAQNLKLDKLNKTKQEAVDKTETKLKSKKSSPHSSKKQVGHKKKPKISKKVLLSECDSASSDDDDNISSKTKRQSKNRKRSKDDSSTDSDTSSENDTDNESVSSSDSDLSTSAQLKRYLTQQEVKELPCFDGSVTQWPSFYRAYKDSKGLFSDSANRNRLSKALTGKAKKAVEGLLVSPKTIKEAINMLKFRFGQSEQIIQGAIDQAMAAENPCEKKPESIVDYAMLVLSLNANIEAVGDESEKINPMLIKSLAERLPFNLQKLWNRKKREMKKKKKLVKVQTFSKWLLGVSQDYVDLVPTKLESKSFSKTKKSINLHETKFETRNDENKKPVDQSTATMPCYKCSSDQHNLGNCKQFREMSYDDRQEFVQKNGLCLVCLKKGHRWRRCYHRYRKGKLVFHELVQKPIDKKPIEKNECGGNQPVNSSEDLKVKVTVAYHQDNVKSLFKIIPVTIHGPVSQFNTFALLDECASATLIEEDVANKLKLHGKVEPLLLGWTKNISSCEEQSRRVRFMISSTQIGSKKYNVKNARTVKQLSLPIQDVDMANLRKTYPYLASAEISDLRRAVPTILIGLDNANLIAPIEVKRDPNDVGPVAIQSKLGWSIHGPESHHTKGKINHTFLICECDRNEDNDRMKIESLMEKYFSVEDFGVKLPIENSGTIEDRKAIAILESTTRRDGDRYVTGLLWKNSKVKMPNNEEVCLRRLVSIELKMEKQPNFRDAYRSKIQSYIDKGYARKLNEQEFEEIKDNYWLLPHFGVTTANKPKMRLVFDAKAVCSGTSLNSQLYVGPDLYNSLVGVLYKLREGEFAVSADVMEMFHQIRIQKDDQKFQCFYWRDGDRDVKPDVFVMEVMTFGMKCSPCSAHFVKNKNALEFEAQSPRAVDGIVNRFYVDDYMDSFSTEEEALEITRQVIEINKKGGFVLRNVISNSNLVRQTLCINELVDVVDLNLEKEIETEKVLGLYWCVKDDEFLFKIKHKDDDGVMTKRRMLKIIMSIFDPLGLLAFYLVRAKIILQDIWLKKIENWDQPLPEDICVRWKIWLDELLKVESLRIPRNYSKNLLKSKCVDLHIFTDASERVYAAVGYLRIEYENQVELCLVTGKTKLASQKASKALTINRMELQGALLGSRLATMIVKEHSINFKSITFWSDSQTVLAWLRSETISFKPFVANRISEILEASEAKQWRHVGTRDNPADDATKSNKFSFDFSCRWFQGPSFLKCSPSEWPVEKQRKAIIEKDPEVKKIYVINELVQHTGDIKTSLFDLEKFSDWQKMKRTTACVMRIADYLRNKVKKRVTEKSPLTVQDIQKAEFYHIRRAQSESYKEEIKDLMKFQAVSNKSKIKNLLPFLDIDGVLRMRGRIDLSLDAPVPMKNPIILHRKHHLTRLILQSYHEKFLHQFQETVVNEVRQKYWIPQLRVAIKSIKKNCQECKNSSAHPIPPQMSKLPAGRLEGFTGCFHHCGIDLFGPIFVTVKRSREKRWGVVFTCLVVRAVYIDLVPDLTADSLILSIRSCNARRGPIRHIYSDCGTNMKGANNELKQALLEIDDDKLQRSCLEMETEWHFNPPASPHMGGCWERLIRSIKAVLKKQMKDRCFKEYTLRSFLCEAEDIINSRPLTYIALESDADEVLTPKHFLNPFFRNEPQTLGKFDNIDLLSKKQWRVVQQMSNHFWNKWVIEYLPMITRTSKWHEKCSPLEVDDIVMICDNSIPRSSWLKAVITEVKTSSDGQVRAALVRTKDGLLWRPAVKLAKLDVHKAAVSSP